MNQTQTSLREPPTNVVRMAVIFEGGIIVLAVVIGWFLNPRLGEWVRWNWPDFGLGLLAALPMLAGLLLMRRVRRGPLGRLNAVVDELLVPLFVGCTVFQLA